MHVILLGTPGAGKGTQAKLMMVQYRVPQISTGDILRAEVKKASPLGRRVKAVLDAGELVSDELILEIVENRLHERDCRNGFILDGFPRTIPQAKGLDGILKRMGEMDLKAIEIAVEDEAIVKRLTSRRVCAECGQMTSVLINPKDRCENCGGKLFQRDDDKEETIRNRLRVYHENTAPLIGYYQQQGVYHMVNGLQPVDAVFAEIQKVIDS